MVSNLYHLQQEVQKESRVRLAQGLSRTAEETRSFANLQESRMFKTVQLMRLQKLQNVYVNLQVFFFCLTSFFLEIPIQIVCFPYARMADIVKFKVMVKVRRFDKL